MKSVPLRASRTLESYASASRVVIGALLNPPSTRLPPPSGLLRPPRHRHRRPRFAAECSRAVSTLGASTIRSPAQQPHLGAVGSAAPAVKLSLPVRHLPVRPRHWSHVIFEDLPSAKAVLYWLYIMSLVDRWPMLGTRHPHATSRCIHGRATTTRRESVPLVLWNDPPDARRWRFAVCGWEVMVSSGGARVEGLTHRLALRHRLRAPKRK
jgi:hypothetical protein